MEFKEFLGVIVGFVATILMYLLSLKDKHQQQDIDSLKGLIDDLYTKHNSDAERLQKLELDVARNNYTKEEINQMLIELKHYMCELFDQLKETIKESKNGH